MSLGPDNSTNMSLHKTYQAFKLDANLMRASHVKHYQPELLSPVFCFALLFAKLNWPSQTWTCAHTCY